MDRAGDEDEEVMRFFEGVGFKEVGILVWGRDELGVGECGLVGLVMVIDEGFVVRLLWVLVNVGENVVLVGWNEVR
ncbi:hypothetical protein, partial [Staphylococcus pettenkoferi]|uniref:hypothetical protein n=1 Tax=Staphylococcus pettenkoferi TaxID=170573 RepID=UPI001C93043F